MTLLGWKKNWEGNTQPPDSQTTLQEWKKKKSILLSCWIHFCHSTNYPSWPTITIFPSWRKKTSKPWLTTHEVCIHFKWKILQIPTCLKHSNHYYPLPSFFPYSVLLFLPEQNLLPKLLCLILYVPSNTLLLIGFPPPSKFSWCHLFIFLAPNFLQSAVLFLT